MLTALAKVVVRLGLAGVIMVIMVVVSGCSGMSRTDSVRDSREPGLGEESDPPHEAQLLPVSALRDDVVLRQSVTIRWQGHEERFEAVLQKLGSELLLVGLGPMNRVGFSLKLDQGGVHFENRTGRDMPFDVTRILFDVQRVFYPWIESAAQCRNCVRRDSQGAVSISERIVDGLLLERRFEVIGGEDRGIIVIGYQDWIGDTGVPGRATLQNAALDYQLIIETNSVEGISIP